MKCFCCKDGNLTNFACNECQNIICFKCINELKNNIELLVLKSDEVAGDIYFMVCYEKNGNYKPTVEIRVNQIDDEYMDLFPIEQKSDAELKWFEYFFKNFNNISGVEFDRFIELYKYIQEKRPDIIFKGM